jgi:hypothetical protein
MVRLYDIFYSHRQGRPLNYGVLPGWAAAFFFSRSLYSYFQWTPFEKRAGGEKTTIFLTAVSLQPINMFDKPFFLFFPAWTLLTIFRYLFQS